MACSSSHSHVLHFITATHLPPSFHLISTWSASSLHQPHLLSHHLFIQRSAQHHAFHSQHATCSIIIARFSVSLLATCHSPVYVRPICSGDIFIVGVNCTFHRLVLFKLIIYFLLVASSVDLGVYSWRLQVYSFESSAAYPFAVQLTFRVVSMLYLTPGLRSHSPLYGSDLVPVKVLLTCLISGHRCRCSRRLVVV